MSSNVMVTCGGKWAGMVLHLKRAMAEVEQLCGGRVIVADRAEITPAGCFADGSIVVPSVSDSAYSDALIAACREHGVRVLVPIIDIDLERLAPHIREFAEVGTTLVCPNVELVDLCMDKVLFGAFAREAGLEYPASYTPEQLNEGLFPLFSKRRRGFGSIGVGICKSLGEARDKLRQYPDLIFQEIIEGPEVSVDAYIAANGNCTVQVQRVRDKVVGGEAMQSHTVGLPGVRDLASRTIAALARRGLRGPLNIQMFAGDRPVLIEVNTRLGSASLLSNVASCGRLFRSVLIEACGGVAEGDPNDYIRGMNLYRFLGDVYHVGSEPLLILPGQGA